MMNSKNISHPLVKIISYINTVFLIIYLKFRKNGFISNKKIIINLWGEVVEIPINHRLPLYSYLYKNYSKNLLRISRYITHKYINYTAIDVGANIGDSAILIRKGSEADIFCVEGDRKFVKILRSNLKSMSNVKIINTFAGEKTGVFKIALKKDNGTGHLAADRSSRKTIVQPLDNIVKVSGKSKIKLLKIDTDGFDGKVIRGSKNIILKDKPVIFFEFDQKQYGAMGDSTYEVLGYLYRKGYVGFMVYDNFGNLLRGLRLKSFVSESTFNSIFDYKYGDYYDLVAFHRIDYDLYKYSFNSEKNIFKRDK